MIDFSDLHFKILQVYNKDQRNKVYIRKGFWKLRQRRFAVQIPRQCVWFKAWNYGRFPGLFD